MCSIVGSFDKEIFKKLLRQNQSRGSFSYSFMAIDVQTGGVFGKKNFGEFDCTVVDSSPDNCYYVGHTQAPTGGLVHDLTRIHPAVMSDSFLFHNGIIKHSDVERLQKTFNTPDNWDTRLFLYAIINQGLKPTLNSIDGSFACVFGTNDAPTSLNVFRSNAGILYCDEDINLSSTFFDNSVRINADTIYTIDFTTKSITPTDTFKSVSSPYYFAD